MIVCFIKNTTLLDIILAKIKSNMNLMRKVRISNNKYLKFI